MFKTTAIDTLKQDKKCQPCWYIILSAMSGSTTSKSLGFIWIGPHQHLSIFVSAAPEGASNSSIVASFNPQRNYASYVTVQVENLTTILININSSSQFASALPV